MTSTRLLTEDEIAAVAGGYEYRGLAGERTPPTSIHYAVGYWTTRGVVGTMQDFVWQLTN